MMSAIAVLVLLAMLGAFIVTLSNTQQISSLRDIQGSRAYYAARAGIEWGAYRALVNGACPFTAALPNAANATGFNVQVVCGPGLTYDEAGTSVTIYQITATATIGGLGQQDYTERQLQVTVSK